MTITNCPKCGSFNITTAGVCENCGWTRFPQVMGAGESKEAIYNLVGEIEIKVSGKALLDDYKRLLLENRNLKERVAELEAERRWHVVKECNDVATPIDVALRKRIAELEGRIDQLTAHDATERQDDKWIPVSERLPDNWESVLTIDISKSTRDMVTAFYNPETSLWSTHFSCDLWVTHWMPLPEPPIVYGKVCEE